MDYQTYNQKFWDKMAENESLWSTKCSTADIQKAKRGEPDLYLLSDFPLPQSWLQSDWKNLDVLALGLAGGSSVPLIAATGANVISLDLSQKQLELDEEVCREHGLNIKTVRGDMQDLSSFASQSFDLVIVLGTSYVKEIKPLWSEIARILRNRGSLISGVLNPIFFALDKEEYDRKNLILKNKIPYDGTKDGEKQSLIARKNLREPIQFGHTLEDLIGGKIQAGFSVTGFKEGFFGQPHKQPIDEILPTFMAIKAQKN